jgi:hypothetical protein
MQITPAFLHIPDVLNLIRNKTPSEITICVKNDHPSKQQLACVVQHAGSIGEDAKA